MTHSLSKVLRTIRESIEQGDSHYDAAMALQRVSNPEPYEPPPRYIVPHWVYQASLDLSRQISEPQEYIVDSMAHGIYRFHDDIWHCSIDAHRAFDTQMRALFG